MSINTIPGTVRKDLSVPESYLDAKSSAIVSAAGQEGISGWVFDISGGESIELESDITDHYTENGSFIQDHIVNKPMRVTLSGLIGELKYEAPKKGSAEGDLSALSNSLTAVTAYLGPLTPQASQKLAVAASAAAYAAGQYEAIKKRVSNLKKYFNGKDATETLQQKAFAELKAMRDSKQIVTVQTPWGFYQNMAIVSISIRQDDKTNDYSDVSVSLKEMRFASVQVTTFDSGSYQSAIDMQAAPATEVGETQGMDTSSSTLYKLFGEGR